MTSLCPADDTAFREEGSGGKWWMASVALACALLAICLCISQSVTSFPRQTLLHFSSLHSLRIYDYQLCKSALFGCLQSHTVLKSCEVRRSAQLDSTAARTSARSSHAGRHKQAVLGTSSWPH